MMCFKRITVLCTAVLFLNAVCGIFTPIVEIDQGKLRGLRSVSGQNRYYGIPYASSQRFEKPTEPAGWKGVFTATERFETCAQTIAILKLGVEDCLRLDVYAPASAKPEDKLPVLIFIHGGAYYYGARAHYDPEFLVTKNTIAVIINYRVGVLGFLCMNGISNLGLRDQVAALKWIRKNIAAFGGDPDNVILSGQSAGASSAALLLLHQSARGLFHKVILMSGTSMTPWAFNFEPLHAAIKDARKLGPVTTVKEVYETFLNASLDDLLKSTRGNSNNPRYFKYAPCMDNEFEDPFFTDTPYNMITTGNFIKVPIILGYVNVEGILFYGLNDDKSFKEWDEQFDERLPSIFSWCSDRDRKKISAKLRSYYFGRKSISSKMVNAVVRFYSDWLVYSTVDNFSSLIARYSDQPIYKYVFGYEGDRNFAKFIFGSRTNMSGATHADEVFYIFKPVGLSLLLNNRDKLFIDKMTTMITNFMKYGDPTPKATRLLPFRWFPTTANNSHTLRLGDVISMTSRTLENKFFSDLLCSYGQKGFVPCESKELCIPRGNSL